MKGDESHSYRRLLLDPEFNSRRYRYNRGKETDTDTSYGRCDVASTFFKPIYCLCNIINCNSSPQHHRLLLRHNPHHPTTPNEHNGPQFLSLPPPLPFLPKGINFLYHQTPPQHQPTTTTLCIIHPFQLPNHPTLIYTSHSTNAPHAMENTL